MTKRNKRKQKEFRRKNVTPRVKLHPNGNVTVSGVPAAALSQMLTAANITVNQLGLKGMYKWPKIPTTPEEAALPQRWVERIPWLIDQLGTALRPHVQSPIYRMMLANQRMRTWIRKYLAEQQGESEYTCSECDYCFDVEDVVKIKGTDWEDVMCVDCYFDDVEEVTEEDAVPRLSEESIEQTTGLEIGLAVQWVPSAETEELTQQGNDLPAHELYELPADAFNRPSTILQD